MKVKQLIELLKKQDPEMEVYIQAEVYESDYMVAQSVKQQTLNIIDFDLCDDEEDEDDAYLYLEAVVIDYE